MLNLGFLKSMPFPRAILNSVSTELIWRPAAFLTRRNLERDLPLRNGFRLDQQMTLMTIGLYNEPKGAYPPSVLF
jgi:hypothetical protein